jgi:hypothetical protein
MTLADILRQEAKSTLLTDIPWLPESVVDSVRACGKYRIICDRHIREVSKSSVPNKYYYPIKQWAEQQGFHVRDEYYPSGVRLIAITL